MPDRYTYAELLQLAAERGYRVHRGDARDADEKKPTGYIVWSRRGWKHYRTIKEAAERVLSGR